MTPYDREILEAIQTAVREAVEASTLPTLPIKYVLRTFTVPDDQKYLEIVYLPNNPADNHWGEEKYYQGLFRLVLHWPNNDEGAYEPMGVLASVCSYFVKGSLLQNVTVSGNPDITGVLEEGAESLFPASIRYSCFRP